jgi:hypothetical protein
MFGPPRAGKTGCNNRPVKGAGVMSVAQAELGPCFDLDPWRRTSLSGVWGIYFCIGLPAAASAPLVDWISDRGVHCSWFGITICDRDLTARLYRRRFPGAIKSTAIAAD